MSTKTDAELLRAIERGDAARAEKLLKSGSTPTADMLRLSVRDRSGKLCALLIAAGADPNPSGLPSDSPLMRAIDQDNAKAVRTLLIAGADPGPYTYRNNTYVSALTEAVHRGRPEIATELLSTHSHIDALLELGLTPLMLAAREGHDAVMSLLLAAGADPSVKDAAGLSASDYLKGRDYDAGA